MKLINSGDLIVAWNNNGIQRWAAQFWESRLTFSEFEFALT